MINQRYKEKDDLKLVGRGHIPLGLGVFFLCFLTLFIGLIIYTSADELRAPDWREVESLWPLFLLSILGIPTILLAIGLLPLRWNAENGLQHKPLRMGFKALVAGIFWSIFSVGCCIGFFLAEPVIGEELPRRLFFAIMGLISGYAGVYFLYQFLKHWQQYRRFGNSQLAIISGVPRRGEKIKVQLIEKDLLQSLEAIQIRFANIQERPEKKKREKKAVRMIRERLYEWTGTVSPSQMITKGIDLEIPTQNTNPTHYHRTQPTYWELELIKGDIEYQARFLIYVTK